VATSRRRAEAEWTWIGEETFLNRIIPTSSSATVSTPPAACLVASVIRSCPSVAAAETRAATLTVAPHQSPPRASAGPVWMPAWIGGNPFSPSSFISATASRSSAAAESPRTITASPIWWTSSTPCFSAIFETSVPNRIATSAATSSPPFSLSAEYPQMSANRKVWSWRLDIL
jgi:hypothetical protein